MLVLKRKDYTALALSGNLQITHDREQPDHEWVRIVGRDRKARYVLFDMSYQDLRTNISKDGLPPDIENVVLAGVAHMLGNRTGVISEESFKYDILDYVRATLKSRVVTFSTEPDLRRVLLERFKIAAGQYTEEEVLRSVSDLDQNGSVRRTFKHLVADKHLRRAWTFSRRWVVTHKGSQLL